MNAIPTGYMENAMGHLIPVEKVKEIDKARNDLVMEIVGKAREMRELLAKFKGGAMADVGAFVELSAEKYDAKIGGAKGNVTLMSYDGRCKVQRAISEHITFAEQLKAAKTLIDDCLREWTRDSDVNLRAIIDHAFQVDKEGRINTGRILGLRRLDITDARWEKAMLAISDAIQVTGTKAYIRIYERNAAGGYDAIPLDVAVI